MEASKFPAFRGQGERLTILYNKKLGTSAVSRDEHITVFDCNWKRIGGTRPSARGILRGIPAKTAQNNRKLVVVWG